MSRVSTLGYILDLEKTTNMDIEQTEVVSESTLRLWAVNQKITGKTVDILVKEGFCSMEALTLVGG